jgi:hypothetical protein
MTLALLVEPSRHPRRVLGIARIAPGSGCTSAPAAAGVLAFAGFTWVVLTQKPASRSKASLERTGGLIPHNSLAHPGIVNALQTESLASAVIILGGGDDETIEFRILSPMADQG